MIKPLLLSLISGLSTLLGCIFLYINVKNKYKFICISLSMIIMISISLFELIPDSVNTIILNYKLVFALLIIILVFLLGYLTIYMINIGNDKSLYRIGIISFISLLLHNIPVGIALFISSYKSIKIGLKLCVSMILHNTVEGMSIALPIYYSKKSRGSAIIMTSISALAEPLGALLSYIFLRGYMNELLLSFILIFVAGLMISLSINEIYIELYKYNIKYKKIGLIIGVIISLLLIII